MDKISVSLAASNKERLHIGQRVLVLMGSELVAPEFGVIEEFRRVSHPELGNFPQTIIRLDEPDSRGGIRYVSGYNTPLCSRRGRVRLSRAGPSARDEFFMQDATIV